MINYPADKNEKQKTRHDELAKLPLRGHVAFSGFIGGKS